MALSLFGKSAYIGIDIGHFSIKAVTLEKTSVGWRVTSASTVPTPEDAVRDGQVSDPAAVGAVIKEIIGKGKNAPTTAILSVFGNNVIVRVVRMPAMSAATLRKSIRFEAERYIPNNTKDSYIDFEIIKVGDDGQMDVLLVAAPRDVVQSRIAACEAAGLDIEVVDLSPFAAFRALIESDTIRDWNDKTFALVDFGASSSNISVIQNGVFTMTRTLPHGGKMMTDALAGFFKLSKEDAESGKNQLDLKMLLAEGPCEHPPLRIILPHLDELVRELRRSLNFFQTQQNQNSEETPISQMVIAGGGAKMSGFAEFLSAKLQMKVTSLGVFENPRFSYAGTDEIGEGLDLAVATGLAMRPLQEAA